MNTTGKNYQATSVGDIQAKGRVTLHNELALTGSEVSINELPPGVNVPFVHSHKRNEEVYIVVKGKGRFYVDGDEFEVAEGSVIRVDPAGQRCVTADNQTPIRYVCILRIPTDFGHGSDVRPDSGPMQAGHRSD